MQVNATKRSSFINHAVYISTQRFMQRSMAYILLYINTLYKIYKKVNAKITQ